MGNRRRLRILGGLLAALCTALAGCWDHRELDEVAWVLAIGLDQGEQAPLRMTSMVAVPAGMAGEGAGGGGDKEPVMVTSVEGHSVAQMWTLMDAYMDRQVSFEHTKTLIFGEDLVRAGIGGLLDGFNRMRGFRPEVRIMVARGQEAGKLLKEIKPKLAKDPSRFLELLPQSIPETGTLPKFGTLHHTLTEMEAPGVEPVVYLVAFREAAEQKEGGQEGQEGEQARAAWAVAAAADGQEAAGGPETGRAWLPGKLPRQGGTNVEIIGGAILSGGRMVGEAAGLEMLMINMVRGTFTRSRLSIPDPIDPTEQVLVELKRARSPVVRVGLTGRYPHMQLTVPLEAELMGLGTGVDYTAPDQRLRLEQAVAGYLTDRLAGVIARAQQEWRVDVLGLGSHAARRFATEPAWRAYDWGSRFPEAEVEGKVEVDFRRYGIQLGPLPVQSERPQDSE